MIIDEQRLLREIELQSKIYITLKSEYEMTQIEEAGAVTSIQVLDKPEIPLKKLKPNLFKFMLYTFTSILLCMIIIFTREWYALNKII